MTKKRLLVLYGPGGNGHKSGAKMIKETFSRKYPEHEVIVWDVVDIANPFLKFCLELYDNLLKADPKYVKYGFNLMNNINSDKALTPFFPRTINMLASKLDEVKPDVVVSVYSAINNFIVAAMKQLGWYNKIPFTIVCTDLTDKFLNGWVHPEANLMIGFLEESKKQMVEYGMPAEKIQVLGGPPVNPLFSDNSLTKADARKMFGLQDDVFTVLIMSGGIGLKTIYTFTKQLVNSSLPVQLLVCCGKNEKLKAKVDKLVKHTKKNVKVFGFTDQVHNLMDAADVIVTKPGPGVIAEAIVKELPIVLDNISEIMPQEFGNVEYVLSNGVGKKVSELSSFHNHIASFIYNDEELPKMRGNMKRLRKTESSDKLAEMLMQLAQEGFASELLREEAKTQVEEETLVKI
jgi:UDP-N-acetylglucosamine:LPS N-acetylglucosamine transferase